MPDLSQPSLIIKVQANNIDTNRSITPAPSSPHLTSNANKPISLRTSHRVLSPYATLPQTHSPRANLHNHNRPLIGRQAHSVRFARPNTQVPSKHSIPICLQCFDRNLLTKRTKTNPSMLYRSAHAVLRTPSAKYAPQPHVTQSAQHQQAPR